tara:strand:- start:2281 stop:2445 length:165 start_codon:yes stop_codon:yes gene_type:complete
VNVVYTNQYRYGHKLLLVFVVSSIIPRYYLEVKQKRWADIINIGPRTTIYKEAE